MSHADADSASSTAKKFAQNCDQFARPRFPCPPLRTPQSLHVDTVGNEELHPAQPIPSSTHFHQSLSAGAPATAVAVALRVCLQLHQLALEASDSLLLPCSHFRFCLLRHKQAQAPPARASSTNSLFTIKKFFVLAAVATTALLGSANADALQVGVDQPHAVSVAAGKSHQEVISYPHASYVAVHFSQFDLPEGDVVIVRSPDNSVSYQYTRLGRADRGDKGGFYATFIPGNTAIVEYTSAGTAATESASGFTIDKFARGVENQSESICGSTDETRPAKCFKSSKPREYANAQAVARLLINGSGACTGWLIGSEGHLITNRHCIKDASDAEAVDIEFGAESKSCADKCEIRLGCKGTVVANSATFIANNEEHDWALLKLPESVNLSRYGYLQLRASGPVVNEPIYIPQHPKGWAKRIVDVVDDGSAATIKSVNVEVGYMADTQPGSSGSPVISVNDNSVVALHHLGGCENSAVNVVNIISDFEANGISINNLLA